MMNLKNYPSKELQIDVKVCILAKLH